MNDDASRGRGQSFQADFETIFSALPGCFVALEPDPPRYTVLGVSDAYLDAIRMQRCDLVGRGLFDVFPQDTDDGRASLERVLRSRRPDQTSAVLNTPVLNEDGDLRYVVQRIDNGAYEASLGVPKPTVRQAVSDTLLDSAEFSIAVLSGPELRYTQVNRAYQALRPDFPMTGHTYREVFPAATDAGLEALLKEVLETGETRTRYKVPFPVPGTPHAAWDFRAARLPPIEGSTPSVLLITWDATARAQALAALRESEQRLSLAVDGAGMGTWDVDCATEQAIWSQNLFEILGYPPDAAGKATRAMWRSRVHPDDFAKVEQALTHARNGAAAYRLEYRIVRADNAEVRWLSVFGQFLRDHDSGEITRFLGVLFDVTDRKREQEALARERNLLGSIMRATDVMLVYLDPDFNFIWVNAAYAATCHHSPEEMVGKNHFALYPHAENEAIFRNVLDTGEPVFQKDKPFEFPDQPERGTTFWDWSLVPVPDHSGNIQGLVMSLRETTRYMRAEMALRESEERFRLFMNNSPTIVWIKDEAGRHVYLNRTYEERFGVRLADRRGKTDAELWPPETAAMFRRNDLAVLAGGHPIEVVEETIDPDGSRCYWLNYKFPFRDAAGERFVAGIGTDITALKQAHVAAEAANEAKDRFLAMVSHELRTPLTAALYAAFALRNEQSLPSGALRPLEIIDRSLALERRLIDDLLDSARITSGKLHLEKRPMDIAGAIREAVRVVSGELDAKHQSLKVNVPGAPYPAVADAGRLQQVFWNLLQNAIKFSPKGSPIVIRAHIVSGHGESEQLLTEVIDHGSGIDPQVIPRLFDAFEQEDKARKMRGLGLGLSICKAIVELHGGRISAHSKGEGLGATFRVRLPLDRSRRTSEPVETGPECET